jgi:uncharacterized protein (DUF2062 family)
MESFPQSVRLSRWSPMWSVEQLKARLKEMLSARSSAHEVALGFTIGTFISILPTPGFNLLLGALVVAVYRHVNKLAVFGAMALYNPLVIIPFYWASYKVGGLIFGLDPVIHYDGVVISEAYDFTRRYLVGNLIVAVITSMVTYPLIREIVHLRRSRASQSSGANS